MSGVHPCDPVAALSARERSACRQLLAQHFHGVDDAGFDADRAAKTHVLRLWRRRTLVGFSTLAARDMATDRGPLRVVLNGDTIVDPAAWGSPILAVAWLDAVRRTTAGSLHPAYWLLICSGARTYRLLTLFWQRYVPHLAGDDPDLLALRDHLARRCYNEQYHDGSVRLDRPQVLRDHLRDLPAHYRSDPHSRFFAAINPAHESGDECVCLCPLTAENLSRAGRRIARLQERLAPEGVR
jgi:hypothetical protein